MGCIPLTKEETENARRKLYERGGLFYEDYADIWNDQQSIQGKLSNIIITGDSATALARFKYNYEGDPMEREDSINFAKENGRWKIDETQEGFSQYGFVRNSPQFDMVKFMVDIILAYGDGEMTDRVEAISGYVQEYGIDSFKPYIKSKSYPPDFEAYLDRQIEYYADFYGDSESEYPPDTQYNYEYEPEPYYEPSIYSDKDMENKKQEDKKQYQILMESVQDDEIVLSGTIHIENWYHGGNGTWWNAVILQLDTPIDNITLPGIIDEGDVTLENINEIMLSNLPQDAEQSGYHVVIKGKPSLGGGTIYYRRAITVDVIEYY